MFIMMTNDNMNKCWSSEDDNNHDKDDFSDHGHDGEKMTVKSVRIVTK